MEQLRELSNELGQPSATKLWQEAQKRDLDVTRKQVLEFTQSQPARQVLGKRPKYEGKIVAVEINDRWAADLIDYNARPSPDKKGDPYQYSRDFCACPQVQVTRGCPASLRIDRS